jgi:hypothetical protein
MPKTDFFDDDLVKHREGAKRLRMGPGDSAPPPGPEPNSSDIPSRPVSDLNLTRMARHKEEVSSQVAHAMEELERLRTRQEDLEREKQELEELRRKQHEYESGKREVVTHLNQSLVKLEKDELNAEKLTEMLSSTRKQFTALLAEVEELNEESWPEESMRDELNKALTRIDQVRIEYNKALSRIDAITPEARHSVAEHQPMMYEDQVGGTGEERGFGYWVKVGLAVSLPLILTLLVLAVLSHLVETGLLL